MSDLESVMRGRIALKEGGDLKTIAAAMLDPGALAPVESTPTAPAPMKLTDEFGDNLVRLPAVFGKVQPHRLGKLTEEQVVKLHDEYGVLKTVLDTLKTREAGIKTIVRGHMAAEAAEDEKVTEDTEYDKHGFPVIARKGAPQRSAVPGTNQVFSLEFRAGSPEIMEDRLLELYETGQIDRKTYLSFTREVRVFDEERALKAIQDDPELLELLRQITRRSRVGTNFHVRQPK